MSNGSEITRLPTVALAGAEPRRVEFTAEQRLMIRDTFANGASDSEFAVLMEIAKARNLNPLTRQIHFVQRWDPDKERKVWQPQVAIDGFRALAERTGLYAGQDEPEYEHDKEGRPTVCRVRVYRRDWPRPAVGVAYYAEYVQKKRDGSPTMTWATKAHIMLAKCAEALAIRKAFPEDTSGIVAPEEMGDEAAALSAPPPPVPALPPRAAQAQPENGGPTEVPPPDPIPADPDDPLAEFRAALASAADRATLNRLIKEIRSLPEAVQGEAKRLYGERAKEIK